MRELYGALCLLLALQTSSARAFDSWVERRDQGVVRQTRDFSCGLAALATLLTYDYADPTTEEELLRQFGAGIDTTQSAESVGVSFADLAKLARARGYRVGGYSVAAQHLQAFQVPVLVHLHVAGRSHFSVLRGVSEAGDAWLADPSWGNRRLAASEFQRLFQSDDASPQGRVLLVVPSPEQAAVRPTDAARFDGEALSVQIAPILE